MKTIILPKPHHHIFEDAAKTFTEVPSDDVLCFGVQDWTLKEIIEQKKIAKNKLIAYQSELLNAINTPFRNDEYISKLKQFDEVWDYSEHNIDFLRQNGVNNVHYKPLLPNPILIDTPVEKDIDILHFGLWTRHRTDILNRLLEMGYHIYDVIREHGECLYGNNMHQLILRSKVVLGIHSYPQSPIQESFRYQYPLSNGVPVLAEKSLSNPLHLIEFSDIKELSCNLTKLGIRQNPDSTYFLQHCFFPFYNSYNEESTRLIESGAFKDVTNSILCQISKDSNLVCQLFKARIRPEEARIVSNKIFDALMWLTMHLKKTNNLGKEEKEMFFSKMQFIYGQLHRPILRKQLSSTGGFLMPNLRCLLLLSGWPLFKWAISLSIKLKKEDKLTYFLSQQAG